MSWWCIELNSIEYFSPTCVCVSVCLHSIYLRCLSNIPWYDDIICVGSLERSGSGTIRDERTSTSRPSPLLHSASLESSSEKQFQHLGNSSADETSRAKKALAGKLCDTKIFVVWLESFEDSFSFPASA